MSFGSITTPNGVFNERAQGTYIDSTVGFGSPNNEFRLRPNTNKKSPSIAITRTKQADITNPNSTVSRVSASAQLVLILPPSGMTASDVDALVTDIASFCDAGVITRLVQGES